MWSSSAGPQLPYCRDAVRRATRRLRKRLNHSRLLIFRPSSLKRRASNNRTVEGAAGSLPQSHKVLFSFVPDRKT